MLRGMSIVSVVGLGVALDDRGTDGDADCGATDDRVAWPLRFNSDMLVREAQFSAGMFAAQAAGTLVNQGDRMIVAALGSTAMAGLYALCVNIANTPSRRSSPSTLSCCPMPPGCRPRGATT